LPADEPASITFAEARKLFSTKDEQYAFGEADDDGRQNIESFAARHHSGISFMPAEASLFRTPLTSSMPCRRIRSRLLFRDQFPRLIIVIPPQAFKAANIL
jgi:hypothetical protein